MTDPSVFRVLAMDGGDGQVTALLLQELSQRLKAKYPQTEGRFLEEVLLYAGTSAGGINSLLIAQQKDPDAFIQSALPALWQQILLAMLPLPPMPPPNPGAALETFGPLGALLYPAQLAAWALQLGLAVIGLHNFVDNDKIKAILTGQLGADTLADLHKVVTIVSFQLDSGEGQNRTWIPRIFTNIPKRLDPDNKDLTELCVDVGLRTSAQPVYFPIYQGEAGTGPGFIDGGYVANNPGMVAIARALEVVRKLSTGGSMAAPLAVAAATATPGDAEPLGKGLDAFAAANKAPAPLAANALVASAPTAADDAQGKVLMLSLGAGATNPFPGPEYIGPEQVKFYGGSAFWGYLHWLLNPTQPFALLNALLSGQMEEISYQLDVVLNTPGDVPSYFRLAPVVKNSKDISETQKKLILDANSAYIDATVDWLVASGWVSVPTQTAPVTPAEASPDVKRPRKSAK